ncbi:hypothetical protein NDU88_002939 [Pleurodeles waltl]|uniref:Myb/SANT-like DNA-binding domain-containing protein n=1 Tax=Pleurodeles waltl TaxID=8319 RepID=A0AAV7M3U8_PLEWA|nr:hypothetical protein NDU88_002939 [Pleurodeles waltl]
MVEEIIRVEPQLFGTQVQHTTIARKAELWQRIVNRVNAVGQHPRNREDIRKRWNDLRGKVRSMVSRHNIAVQKTGGGPPPTPPEFTAWEQEVFNILHPEGLAGVGGGMDSGPERQHTGQEGPELSIPPPEQAPSDDSSSVDLEPDDQPRPSGTSGQSVTLRQPQATADLPPSGNTSTAPTQQAHASVSRTGQAAVCLPVQGTQGNPPPQQQQGPGGSGSGHTVQGTEAQEQRGTGRAAVRRGGQAQRTHCPRGPHHHHGSVPPLPRDDGDGPDQVPGDPASAGATVYGVPGRTAQHQFRNGYNGGGIQPDCHHFAGPCGPPKVPCH